MYVRTINHSLFEIFCAQEFKYSNLIKCLALLCSLVGHSRATGFLNDTVYFGTLISPFSTKSFLR